MSEPDNMNEPSGDEPEDGARELTEDELDDVAGGSAAMAQPRLP